LTTRFRRRERLGVFASWTTASARDSTTSSAPEERSRSPAPAIFSNNPLLRERGLRFYAGVPLRSNNFPIGSLCILDVKPRRMTEREKRLLEVIGEDVIEEIQRRDGVGSPSLL